MTLQGRPWAAIGHLLDAVATELANGRRLPIEVRRAALHMVKAIDESAGGAAGTSRAD